MGGHRSGVSLAAAAVVVAAGAATLLLRPRSGLIEPAAVDLKAYFSAEQLERARDFRGPQRVLGLAGLAASGASLAVLALRPPPVVRRGLERASRRPLAGAAVTGAGISLVLVAVALPLDVVRHERSVDVGLSTQTLGAWFADVGKEAAIGALFAGAGGALAVGLMRRFPRRWWIPSSAAVVALTALYVFVSPILLDPLFNRFERLPQGRLRSDVVELAQKAGIEVGEVYRVDASRRTTGANAYVGGLGATKRVVLYDNLIEDFPPAQVRSVVAHELGHVKGRDLLRGLAWLALVAPAALFLVQRLTDTIAARHGARGATAATLPALALALALISFAIGCMSNVLSRRVEARADAFALEIAGDAGAFIDLERRLALQNVAEPDPPGLFHDLFGTHPTTRERIGFGISWSARR